MSGRVNVMLYYVEKNGLGWRAHGNLHERKGDEEAVIVQVLLNEVWYHCQIQGAIARSKFLRKNDHEPIFRKIFF